MSGQDQNVFQQASSAYTGGQQGLAHVANPNAMFNTMNQFANPYKEKVLDATLKRMQERRARDLSGIKAQAAQAGAYGGARHGLVEAEYMDDYGQQENEVISRLLQDSFVTSADLASTSLGHTAGASSGLIESAPVGFNMGTAATSGVERAGTIQQQLLQSILRQAGAQYEGYANYPNTALGTAMAGLQGNPLTAANTQTQQFNPGLLNYLQLGGGVYAAGK